MVSVNKLVKLIEKEMDKNNVDSFTRVLIYSQLSNEFWKLTTKYAKKAIREVHKGESKRRKKRKNK